MRNTRKLKRQYSIIFFLLIFSIVGLRAYAIVAQETTSDIWDRAKKAFENYFDYPTRKNICEALNALPPDEKLKELPWTFKIIIDYEFNPDVLSMDAESGNICAALVVSKLLKYVDVETRRSFVFSIWRLLRNKPEIFLKVFRDENISAFFLQWVFPIALDRLSRERIVYEINNRINAIKSVDTPELTEIGKKYVQFFDWYLGYKGLKDVTYCKEEKLSLQDFPFEERVRKAMDAVIRVPCEQNIKNLMEILSERGNIKDIIDVDAPKSPWFKPVRNLFEALRYESLCGNTHAVEFLLKYIALFMNPGPIYYGVMSEILFINPAIFISSLGGRKEQLTNSSIAEYVLAFPLWYQADDKVFYERRIEALSALSLPENKKLINIIIDLLKEEVAKNKDRVLHQNIFYNGN
ncbi:MAG: hypothetical protein NUW11_10700 [Candidatus Saccharicenans sp.]|jgi:hypothetical protein|nr:hypothetical protein [Candidatus Saccharicenans sp.]